MALTNPLTDEEFQELEEFLMSDATGEEAMDISMLDGFLTALAIGPNNLPPSLWLPMVWGGEMTWQSKQQAERMISYVLRHANDILFYLRDDPDAFEPLIFVREHEGKTIPIIDEWCMGFVRGMALDEEAWQPLIESDEGSELLEAILLYGTESGWKSLENNPELADRHDEFAAGLGKSVVAIQKWWLPVRLAKSTVRRDEPKVGRNDLCPCGSGRKFKKCCGAPGKVVH
jgi:uncharacterized protein